MGINLLPPQYHSHSKIKKKNFKTIFPGIIIILCFVLVGIGYYFYRIDLEKDLAILKEKAVNAGIAYETVKHNQATLNNLNGLANIKEKTDENLKLWNYIFDIVVSKMENQLWIKEINSQQGIMVIKGEVSDLEVASYFLQEINQMSWLENIEIKVAERIITEQSLLNNERDIDLFQRIEDREEIQLKDRLIFLLTAEINKEWQLPDFKGGEP